MYIWVPLKILWSNRIKYTVNRKLSLRPYLLSIAIYNMVSEQGGPDSKGALELYCTGALMGPETGKATREKDVFGIFQQWAIGFLVGTALHTAGYVPSLASTYLTLANPEVTVTPKIVLHISKCPQGGLSPLSNHYHIFTNKPWWMKWNSIWRK